MQSEFATITFGLSLRAYKERDEPATRDLRWRLEILDSRYALDMTRRLAADTILRYQRKEIDRLLLVLKPIAFGLPIVRCPLVSHPHIKVIKLQGNQYKRDGIWRYATG